MLDFFLEPIILVGFLVGTGIALSFMFQKIGIPHVVVYILTGFVLSNTIYAGSDFLTDYSQMFHIVEIGALGLIGFKIGTELNVDSLIKQTKSLIALVVGNTGMAMVLVSIVVFIMATTYTFTERWVLALVLGAVATATAPAATVEIIRKYKSKGTLTTLILAVLALNDLVAIISVEVMLVIIRGSFTSTFGVGTFLLGLGQEIGLAVLIGFVIGFCLDIVVERMHDDLEMMELTLGVLIFTIGVTDFLHTSPILATMVVGITVTNRKGNNYERAEDLLEIIMSPVITLFFVLVGAKILIGDFSPFPYLVIVYFLVRLIGKYLGSYLGAAAIGQTEEVKNNFGLAMVAQGGVALGLASIIGETLIEVGESNLASLVVSIIIIGTVFSEILGTLTAKYGLTKAGDIVREAPVTEEGDHLRTVHVHD